MARLSWTHYTFGDGTGHLVGSAEPFEMPRFEPESWTRDAACREPRDLDDWHQPPNSLRTKAAREVCATCPVREQCLDFAIRNRIDNGIWGGLTEKELRALLLKAYKKARAKTLVVIRPKRRKAAS
jgi:WhiB family redox-sensing transcriptional regulator